MKPPAKLRPWIVVALLWFTVLFNYFVRLLPTTMHTSIVAAMPMSEAQFGLLTAALFWSFGLMSPFGGFLADRFNRSGVIIASSFLWSALTWLMSHARTFDELLVLRALIGVSEACYTPASLALICDYHTGATRSLATGIHSTGSVIGSAMSGLGGWLAERFGWHYAFGIVGVVGIAYSVVLLCTLRDNPGVHRAVTGERQPKAVVRVGEALPNLFARGSFWLTFFAAALIGLIAWTIAVWMPVFLQERFHLTQAVAGFTATGYMNAAALPGVIIGGIWADRWSRTNGRARMLVPAIGFLLAVPGILLIANAGVLLAAIAGLIGYRVFMAFFEPNLMPILCDVVDARYRATGYGLINMMATVSAGVGIYLSGVVRDLHIELQVVFECAAGAAVICGLLFYFIKPMGSSGESPLR